MSTPSFQTPNVAAPTPDEIAADPSKAIRHSDFGEETRQCDLTDRSFHYGERVKIARPTHVIDKERRQEGMAHIPIKDRPALEVSVTGEYGEVQNESYWSEEKQTHMVPVELEQGGLVYVDEKKLERPKNEALRGMGQNSRVTTAMSPQMTAADRKLGADFTRYQAAQRAAFLDGNAFPSFPDWLTLQETKKE